MTETKNSGDKNNRPFLEVCSDIKVFSDGSKIACGLCKECMELNENAN